MNRQDRCLRCVLVLLSLALCVAPALIGCRLPPLDLDTSLEASGGGDAAANGSDGIAPVALLIELPPHPVEQGSYSWLTARLVWEDGSTDEITQECEWTSADTSALSVEHSGLDAGRLQPFSPASIDITASYYDAALESTLTDTVTVQVLPQRVFRVTLDGLDVSGGGDGSDWAPFRTVNAGLDAAVADSEVWVAAGEYDVADAVALLVKPSVALLGGFAPDFSERIPEIWESIIRNNGAGGGSGTEPVATLAARGADVGSDVLIDSFTIEGPDGEFSAAVSVDDGADPRFTRNTILGGPTTQGSAGVFVGADAAPVFEQNRISGGASDNDSVGVYVTSGASPLLRNNLIHGGSGVTSSQGVFVSVGATAMIHANTIYSGVTPDFSEGIRLQEATASIVNNIIFANSGTLSAYGIREEGAADLLEVLNNNISASVAYQDAGGASHTDVLDMEAALASRSIPAADNHGYPIEPELIDADGADANIATMSDNHWELAASAPVDVREGGLDMSSDFAVDFRGAQRTVPWSIGAYEVD
jgi:hypothetical protein